MPEQKLLEIEELLLPDTMTIELNVTHGERRCYFSDRLMNFLQEQQCTAVLHLLLLDNQDLKTLISLKIIWITHLLPNALLQSFVELNLVVNFFATHNANIPVFGDAEWIGCVAAQDNKGMIRQINKVRLMYQKFKSWQPIY